MELLIISLLLPLLLGIPLSIYTGFVSARIMTFQEHRNRALVLIGRIRDAFTKKESLVQALSQAEEIKTTGLLLLEAGHKVAGYAIVAAGEEFIQTLREKIHWRDTITEKDPSWRLYTPVFSDEKLNKLSVPIRQAKMKLSVILSASPQR